MDDKAMITDIDKSALVDIFVWLLLAVATLAVVAQTATKIAIRKKLATEDYIILSSLLLTVGQSVSVDIQTQNGFGRHLNALSDSQAESALKAEYAASLLFIPNIFLTKLSMLVLVRRFALVKQYKYTVYALGGFVTLWSVASLITVTFQCRLPVPWDHVHRSCVDRKNFWNAYGAMNMASDLVQVVLMTIIAAGIQTSISRKITIASVFGARMLVVVAVILQLFYLNRAGDSKDPTFDYWQHSICTQSVQCLALVTACIPYLKPFLDSLESGFLRADDQYRRDTSKAASYLYNVSNSKGSDRKGLGRNERKGDFTEMGVLSSNRSGRGHLRGHGHTKIEGGGSNDWDETNSQSSQSRIIKETRTFTVNVEPRDVY